MFPTSSYLSKRLLDAHIQELRRIGARSRMATRVKVLGGTMTPGRNTDRF
jgi:hypothetical protein